MFICRGLSVNKVNDLNDATFALLFGNLHTLGYFLPNIKQDWESLKKPL